MARKLTATCLDITPDYRKIRAIPGNLEREVFKCIEEISQQAVNTRTVVGLAQFIIAENYQQQNSAVPAIVIKRHGLLEHWYNTRSIFNQCTRHPTPRDQEVDDDDVEDLFGPEEYVYTNVPSIEQFRGHIAQALYARGGREPAFTIEGTWEDCKALFQEELPFILALTPPEP